MSRRDINLAARPFANERPVKRVSMLVWVVGGLLAAINVVLYWQAIFGLEDAKDQLFEVEAAIEDERRLVSEAEDALRAMDLRQQNAEATFLNQRIDERTFPWSRLFDELARVLPRGIRLHSLRPVESEQEIRLATTGGRRIHLSASGTADSFEALLELLDGLFDDPTFANPKLPKHSLQNDGNLRFQIEVDYFPDSPVQSTADSEALAAERSLLSGPGSEVAAVPGSPGEGAGTGSAEVAARSPESDQPPAAMTSGEPAPMATELTPEVVGDVDVAADSTSADSGAVVGPGAAGSTEATVGSVGTGAAVGTGARAGVPAPEDRRKPLGLGRTASGPGGRR